MSRADSGLPKIAPNHLGARLDGDIPVDAECMVCPDTGGMSVTPDDPADLPQSVRPRQYGGTGRRPVWVISSSSLPPTLRYRRDKPSHGLIEPSERMTSQQYLEELARTADDWTLLNE
jgi:hypothetical protein